MNKNKHLYYIILIAVLHLTAFFLFFRFELFLDGYPYLYWGHSIVYSQDIQMYNQNSMLPGGLGVNQLNENGYGNNIFPMGHSLVYMPMLINSYISENIAVKLGYQYEDAGYSQTTYFNYLLLSFFLCLLSHIFIFCILSRFFSLLSSFLASVFVFFGTVIFGYSYLISSYSHTTALFFTSLMIFFFTKNDMDIKTKFYIYASISSLLLIIRYDALVYTIIPLYEFFRHKIYKKPGIILNCIFISFIFLSPQIIAYYVINGSLVLSSNESLSVLISGISDNLFLFFFHPRSGLFTLTPVTILGFAGLLAGLKKIRYSYLFLFIMLLEYLQMTLRIDLIAGNIYGMRRFFSSLIFICIGLAYLFDYLKRKNFNLFIFSVLSSGLLSLYYLSRITVIELFPAEKAQFVFRKILANMLILPSFNGFLMMIRRGFLARIVSVYKYSYNFTGLLISLIFFVSFAIIIFAVFRRLKETNYFKAIMIIMIIYTIAINILIIRSHINSAAFTFVPVDKSLYQAQKHERDTKNKDKAREGIKTPFNLFIESGRDEIKLTDICKFWGEKYRFGKPVHDLPYKRKFDNSIGFSKLAFIFTMPSGKINFEKDLNYLIEYVSKMSFIINNENREYNCSDIMTILSDITQDQIEIRHKVIFNFQDTPFLDVIEIEDERNEVAEIRLTGICIG